MQRHSHCLPRARLVDEVGRLFVAALLALQLFLHRGTSVNLLIRGSSWPQILSQVCSRVWLTSKDGLHFVMTRTECAPDGMHYGVSSPRAHLLAMSRPPHHTNTQLSEIIIFLLQLLVHDRLPDRHASHAPSPVQSCFPPITPSCLPR